MKDNKDFFKKLDSAFDKLGEGLDSAFKKVGESFKEMEEALESLNNPSKDTTKEESSVSFTVEGINFLISGDKVSIMTLGKKVSELSLNGKVLYSEKK